MNKLFVYILMLVGSSLAGIAVIAALTLGKDSGTEIAIAAGVGALLSLPVAWLVTTKITDFGKVNKR
jgi:hypothetical protein